MLSGSSSSGKTSLASALLDRLPFAALRIEADRAFPDLSPKAEVEHDELVLAFHRSIAAWAVSGFNLIIDGSLPYGNRPLTAACLQPFAPFDLRLVGVHCSIPVLEKREHDRGDRPIGWAAQQSLDINNDLNLDAIVDTSAGSPEECAALVITDLNLC